MSNPIAGNQNFTKVENLAGQLALARIGEAKVNELQANSVASSVSILLPFSAEVKTLNVVAPSAFATLAAAGATLPVVLSGNTATPSASTDAANATLPAGAVIVAVEFSNNGVTVAGTSDLDLGVAGFNTASANLVTTTTAAILNNGGLVQCSPSATFFASSGDKDQGVVVPAAPNNFLTLTNNTGANTTGAFAATVYYLEQ